jgi:uncharacterized protein related to proFAR isomerase
LLVWIGENITFSQFWWECELVQPAWKAVWRFLKKIKNRTTLYNPITGYISKEYEISMSKRYLYSMFIATLFMITRNEDNLSIYQLMKQKKETMVHSPNGMLFTHKTNEILSLLTTWLKVEIIMLSKVSQVQKRQDLPMISLIRNLKNLIP